MSMRYPENESEAGQNVWDQINKYANQSNTVLITGETGTGKGFFAEEIHERSSRKPKPYREANCALFEGDMLHSELFGHEKGAYTGAHRRRKGLFEQADGGTVLLDEIGTMPLDVQQKLLTFLDDNKKFTRLGGERELHADVRLIAATNADLEELVHHGKFRNDLYYRINGFRPLKVPPLRDRLGEIEHLVAVFIRDYNKKTITQKQIEETIDHKALDYLKQQTWPGNIRQLKSATELACIDCNDCTDTDNVLKIEHFPTEAELSNIHAFKDIPNDLDPLAKNVSTRTQKNFIVETQTIQKVAAAINRVAPYPYSVLITGETGTGKARIAEQIHQRSPRKEQPFITGNCTALSADLFFGNEREALPPIRGLLERATGGTIFLNDIERLPAEGQATLSHLLEKQTFTRLGGERELHADVRFITATNADLAELVHHGKFRNDLYYKLIECRIEVPPLRDRREEIEGLVAHFIRDFNAENQKQIEETIDHKALDYLKQQTWPGNIRQLQAATRGACIHCTGTVLKIGDFPAEAEVSYSPAPQATHHTSAENQRQVAFKQCFEDVKKVLKGEETYQADMKTPRDEDCFTVYVFYTFRERSDLAPSFAQFSDMTLQEMLNIKNLNRNTYNARQRNWNKQDGLSESLCRTLKESEVS